MLTSDMNNALALSDDDAYTLFAQRRKIEAEPPVFMAVKTTGIFCRPGCPARLPKRENCEFFDTAHMALMAGYRACKRCHPTQLPGEASALVKRLTALIEEDPQRRWSEADLWALGIDPSTARRHFKARFNLTFAQYARGRRLGLASRALGKGERVIDAQLTAGYESASGFRSAFAKSFGVAPKKAGGDPLSVAWIDTPMGPMITVSDTDHLYLLEFTDRKNIDRQFQRLSARQKRAILPGRTPITDKIQAEIKAYFAGDLQAFQTPLKTSGTDFQSSVWRALQTIPYGEQWSYAQLAKNIGNAKAVRAVASSNAANGLALIVPCHRVIASNGGLGGYAGGLSRKQWLLSHEAKHRA